MTDRNPRRHPRPPSSEDAPTDLPRVVRTRRATPVPQRRRWPRRLLIGSAAVLAAVALVVAAGAAWGLWSFNRFSREDLKLSSAEDDQPRNFLVIGSDSRAGIDRSQKGSGVMVGKGVPVGQRSDSVSIMRVDPGRQRVDMLSIPRDLWVPIAGTGEDQRINTAYARSTQTLIDTIQQDLGIPIHHFVSVDLEGFQEIVDAIGGIPMYFPDPVRDPNSGLNIPTKGCRLLDGYMGLAFARSRHLLWSDGVRWHSDPTGDLGRMTRQQLLVRTALGKVRTLGLNNVASIKKLVDATVQSVTLDSAMGTGDIIDLAQRFSDFDPSHLQTHSLPVTGHTTSGGASVLLLDEAAAQPVLDLFRGKSASPTSITTTTAPPPDPGDVTVDVRNGTEKQGEARRVSFVLADGGFNTGRVESGEHSEQTVVRYPEGARAMADLVATWLDPTPKVEAKPSLAPGRVEVTIGADFAHVAEPASTPPSRTSTPSGANGTQHTAGGTSSGGAAGSTTSTTEPGWTPGAPPPGAACG